MTTTKRGRRRPRHAAAPPPAGRAPLAGTTEEPRVVRADAAPGRVAPPPELRARPEPIGRRPVAMPSPPPPPTNGETADSRPSWVDQTLQETLTLSYWFEPRADWTGRPVVIRFTGHRLGTGARTSNRDRFVQDERIDAAAPLSGRVCVTARVQDVNPGDWQVVAAVVEPSDGAGSPTRPRAAQPAVPVHRAKWSFRSWSLREDPDESVHTGIAPLARIPGIVPGIWPAMVALGIVVAVVSFALLYGRAGGTGPAPLVVLVALLAGGVGAKALFIVLNWGRKPPEGWVVGWAIQGFVGGLLIAIVVAGILGATPAGIFLDAAAPGVLFGMGAGRIGCFFAGCCVGRPTCSRWGVWSSDRRLGVRRVPTQLMEVALAFALAVASLVYVLTVGTAQGGVFVVSLALYTLLRQAILRLRAESRRSLRGPLLVSAACVVLIAAAVLINTVPSLHLPAGA